MADNRRTPPGARRPGQPPAAPAGRTSGPVPGGAARPPAAAAARRRRRRARGSPAAPRSWCWCSRCWRSPTRPRCGPTSQQRAHIDDLKAQIAQRETNIDALEREKRRWHDPAYVAGAGPRAVRLRDAGRDVVRRARRGGLRLRPS